MNMKDLFLDCIILSTTNGALMSYICLNVSEFLLFSSSCVFLMANLNMIFVHLIFLSNPVVLRLNKKLILQDMIYIKYRIIRIFDKER